MFIGGDPRQTFHHAYAIFQLPGAQASATRLDLRHALDFARQFQKQFAKAWLVGSTFLEQLTVS